MVLTKNGFLKRANSIKHQGQYFQHTVLVNVLQRE